MMKRSFKLLASLAAMGLALDIPLSFAQDAAPKTIKIGYAISKTGPNAGGANITQIPNYQLWIQEVNAKGGLMLKSYGKRIPIEVVEYDDRSNSEEAVRAFERLIEQDKVDLLLPPWGTGINLAVGPIFNKHNFPQITFSAVTDRAPELAKRWPNSFWLLGTSTQYVDALVETLVKLRKESKINDQVAMVSVADGFGIDLSKAARTGLEKAGFKMAFDKSYPIGTQDMSPIVGEAERSKADTFIAFSYPPDTLAITDQARLTSYAPKVMFTGVGTAFPLFPQRFGENVEGVISLGGWSKDNTATTEYREKIKKIVNRDPDYWGSQIGYASLQMLEQAVERVGKLDRPAIVKELQGGTFDTVLGKIKLENNMPKDAFWLLGQWQNGFFIGVAPQRSGVSELIVPKPAWKK